MPDEILIQEVESIKSKLMLKLQTLAWSAGEKYLYYNAKQPMTDLGISLPKNFRAMKPGVGWASRAVNTIGDRLNFDGFANDEYGVNDLFDKSGANAILNKAKTDALIAGCSFIALLPRDGYIELLPFTATEATGEIDERTGLLSTGLAVVAWDSYTDPVRQDMQGWGKVGLIPRDFFVFGRTWTARYKSGNLVEVVVNPTGRPLLHVLTHRQSADRPFGKSRITNTVRRIVDEVGRLKVRYEIAAEFYSTPQRYINGLAEGTEGNAKLETALGKIWAITKDEDGEHPDIGQLPQMTINQFSEQKKDLARDFCAETALTLRNLGYETANPTSAESLSAMSDDLLLEAQESQEELGREFKEIAISMRMLLNSNDSVPATLENIKPVWKPLFQIDFGSAGDAAYKLIQAMPELAGTTTLYRMLGMSIREAEELTRRKNIRPKSFMQIEEGER